MKPKGNSIEMSVSVAPLFLLINSLFKKAAAGLLPKVWDSRRVKGAMNSPVNNFMPEHQPVLEEVES